eukprot:266628-Chlamydomonas_euryale.AAC.3
MLGPPMAPRPAAPAPFTFDSSDGGCGNGQRAGVGVDGGVKDNCGCGCGSHEAGRLVGVRVVVARFVANMLGSWQNCRRDEAGEQALMLCISEGVGVDLASPAGLRAHVSKMVHAHAGARSAPVQDSTGLNGHNLQIIFECGAQPVFHTCSFIYKSTIHFPPCCHRFPNKDTRCKKQYVAIIFPVRAVVCTSCVAAKSATSFAVGDPAQIRDITHSGPLCQFH